MLYNTTELNGHQLHATDGLIGHVKDFYFDDRNWVVRYMVADTGSWLTGRLVLLSPHAFGEFDGEKKTLSVKLTRTQIENSPPIERHQPVSRHYEMDYYRYYGWPAYWDGGAMWGLGGNPVLVPLFNEERAAHVHPHHRDEKHLRSAHAVRGYEIKALDGPVGRVSGLMVDDKSWAIRELVVEAGHWYAGKEILIAPAKIDRISDAESAVLVNLTKTDIERTGAHKIVHAAGDNGEAGGFPKE